MAEVELNCPALEPLEKSLTPVKVASMKKNEPVTKIMSRQLTTVHEGDPVSKVRKFFEVAGVHHLPVVSGERLIGIISWSDILRISFGEYGNQDGRGLDSLLDHTYSLLDIMSSNPTTIASSGTVREAARILGSSSFHSLPVVEGDKLVGLVTSTDLINYLAEL
jgi:CBS domain-containing protein